MAKDIHCRRSKAFVLLIGGSVALLSGCEKPLDFDFRGLGKGFDTTEAAQQAMAPRPLPDSRGVISYPNYQVAVARRGDTIDSVASRVGLPAGELARHNGIPNNVTLRENEIIALPRRVSEPSPATGAVGTGPIRPAEQVDVSTLAGSAIERANGTQTAAAGTDVSAKPLPQTGMEPIRHKVERGETAYSIARLYQVSVKSLAEWNGLDSSLSVREGQFLLIPVANATTKVASAEAIKKPGTGSVTPVPPSAAKPLPAEVVTAAAAPVKNVPPSPDLGKDRSSSSRLGKPAQGKIIRDFAPGKFEGILISANPGDAVSAAGDGKVVLITKSVDDIPILIVDHGNNLKTAYAAIDGIAVKKGDSVKRGQKIAVVRASELKALQFSVFEGTKAVDPTPFLN